MLIYDFFIHFCNDEMVVNNAFDLTVHSAMVDGQGVRCNPVSLYVRACESSIIGQEVARIANEAGNTSLVRFRSQDNIFIFAADMTTVRINLENVVAAKSPNGKVYFAADHTEIKEHWFRKPIKIKKTKLLQLPTNQFSFLFRPISGNLDDALYPDQQIDALISSARQIDDPIQRSITLAKFDELVSNSTGLVKQSHVDALFVLAATDPEPNVRRHALGSLEIVRLMRSDLSVPKEKPVFDRINHLAAANGNEPMLPEPAASGPQPRRLAIK